MKKDNNIINNNIQKILQNINLEFKYANDFRSYTYNDIINYLNNKSYNNKQIYQEEIYQIKYKSVRKNKKKFLKNIVKNII